MRPPRTRVVLLKFIGHFATIKLFRKFLVDIYWLHRCTVRSIQLIKSFLLRTCRSSATVARAYLPFRERSQGDHTGINVNRSLCKSALLLNLFGQNILILIFCSLKMSMRKFSTANLGQKGLRNGEIY